MANYVSFSPEHIAEIRERADIVQIIGRYVTLTKRGRSHLGLCPFHSEKTPSFNVHRERNFFHCFGCEEGGDVISFVMRMEALTFPEAIKQLAGEVGVELPTIEESPEDKRRRTDRDRLIAANDLAASFWNRCLERVPEARRYLVEERGLSEETITRFKLGWAAPSWTMLADLFKKKGIRDADAVQLGLLGRRDRDQSLYDRLRGRVVFPIEGLHGNILGFGARRADWVDAEGAKYLNSTESALYQKSRVLYGLGPAKFDIRRRRQVWLVEGYLDVIALHQAGLPFAVAACGTALAKEHAEMMARMVDEVVTFYDGDDAGRAATYKAAVILLGHGLRVKVVDLPQGEDPDSYVKANGPESVEKLVDQAPSAVDFFVSRARTSVAGGGIAAATRALDQVKPMILAIKDPLTRDVTLESASKALGIDASVLRRHLASKNKPTPKKTAPPKSRETANSVVETALLRCALEHPEKTFNALESEQGYEALESIPIRNAFHKAAEAWRAGRNWDGAQWMDELAALGVDEALRTRIRRDLAEDLQGATDVESIVRDLVKRKLRKQLARIQQELATCEPEAQDALLREAVEITKRIERK